MSSVVISGDTSGAVTLTAPAAAGTVTVTLPAASGTMASLASVTANGVTYVNSSSQPTSGSALVFDGANLGVGVTPNAWRSTFKVLQLTGTATVSSNSNTTVYLGSNWYNNSSGADIYTVTGAAGIYAISAGVHAWYNAPSGTAGNAISLTQAMTLDASGNLGIGTTSPSAKLHLSSTGSTAQIITSTGAANYASISLTNTTTGYGYDVGFGGSTSLAPNSFYVYGGSTASMKMLIDSSGNLLVGKTASAGSTLGGQLNANGQIFSTLSGSTNASTTFEAYSTGAAAYRFYVGMGGTIYATSITITAISDERLKENVRDIDTGLDAIMALKPRRFDWKEGKGQDKKNVAGFIAQEFEDVFPECVGASKAGEDGIEYKNINHETLIPTLVKAIQELKAEFDAYKASHP